MAGLLRINEIYVSIQGESTWSGQRCVFVRLTGCHLRCHYCDTAYAFHEGQRQSIQDILDQVNGYACDLVEITGGEPLLQPGVHELMERLCDGGKAVLIETSGACDIAPCDPRVIRIMDLKTPGSGEVDRNLWANIDHLTHRDEVKFVVCDRDDYEWSKQVIQRYQLHERVKAVLMGAAAAVDPGEHVAGVPGLDLRELTDWVLADRLPVRLQVQLHKLIWEPVARGV